MNKDILKGKWLEIKGRVKETVGKLTDNNLAELEGESEKLRGLLQERYGRMNDKSGLKYKDRVELAEIISRIVRINNNKNDILAITFIARYGRPLLAKNQESQIAKNEQTYGNPIDRYSYARLSRRNTHMASQ